jgi:hypothetical protein
MDAHPRLVRVIVEPQDAIAENLVNFRPAHDLLISAIRELFAHQVAKINGGTIDFTNCLQFNECRSAFPNADLRKAKD